MAGRPGLQRLSGQVERRGGDRVIFDAIADGRSMCSIAEEFNCSRSLVYRWLNMESERKDAWREARRLSAHALVEQAGELLDSAEEIVGITSTHHRTNQPMWRSRCAG